MSNLDHDVLVTLTSDIVSAHVGANTVTPDDVPVLITSVFEALAGLKMAGEQKEERREPAVLIRASVKKDSITCLECGKKMKMLKRHISTEHRITPDEYLQRWQLPSDYPLVAPDYAATRRDLAKKIGLGRALSQKRGQRKAAKK